MRRDRFELDPDFGAITICLYVAIPDQEESDKAIDLWPQRLKSIVKCAIDDVATRISGNLHLDIHHYGIAKAVGGNSNRGDIAIRMAIKQQLTIAFAPRPVQFLEVQWGKLTDEIAEDINRSCDMLVIGGGGYIFLHADGSLGYMMENVKELDKIHCPVFAYGIGLNQLMHENLCALEGLPEITQEKIRYLGDKCELISVRDAETARLFELYSVKCVDLIGDPVLSYVPDMRPRRVSGTGQPVIGINMAAHGKRALSVLKPLLPTLLTFLKGIQRKHTADLVYLQHHDLERPVINFLTARGLKFRTVNGTPSDLLHGYANADFMICQMLHACIFAATAGTPFLNIAYDNKCLSFGQLLNVSECCLPHTEADLAVLEKRFESLFQERALLASRLELEKKDLRLSQVQFANRLAEYEVRRRGP